MGFKIKNGVLKRYTEEKDITEVTIPDSITNIGEGAFWNCKSLKSITIPNSVESIGNYAFGKCHNLTEITVPDNVKSIENMAFFRCRNLKNVELPDSIKSIGDYVFSGCYSIYITIYKGSIKVPFEIKNNWYAYDNTVSLNKFIVSDINDRQRVFYGMTSYYKIPLAMFMMSAYPQETYYSDYLKNNAENAVKLLTDEENINLLYRFLDFGFVTEDNIDELISYAVNHTQNGGSAEPQLILSKYRSDNIGCHGADAMDKFML